MKHRKLTSLLLALSMLALSAAPTFAEEPEKTPSVNITAVTSIDGVVTRTVYDGDGVVTDTYIAGSPKPSPSAEETPAPSDNPEKESEPEATSSPTATLSPADNSDTDISALKEEIINSVTTNVGNALYDTFLFKVIKQYVNQCIEEYLNAADSVES